MDVSWLVFAHQVFQSIAGAFELPGMPDFLREEDVRSTYEQLTSATLGDLTWFHLYNGVIWCVVFMRTGARQLRFGEIEQPEDVETLFHCKPLIDRLLDEVGA
jgi:aminoglycoside phosphotransferase (APT) family kinase protein